MSGGHDYLAEVLASYDPDETEKGNLRDLRNNIEAALRRNLAVTPTIRYGGSYAKSTLIAGASDVDVVVYFRHEAYTTLKGMYDAVWEALAGWSRSQKNVAIALNSSATGARADVVPARRITNDAYDANLYRSQDGSSRKTNIETHLAHVTASGARPLIRLAKIWKTQHYITHFPSFALELAVIKALSGKSKSDYGVAFYSVLKYFAENAKTMTLTDPANAANTIEIPDSIRSSLATFGQSGIDAKYWSDIIQKNPLT